jgi:hypothetical protein
LSDRVVSFEFDYDNYERFFSGLSVYNTLHFATIHTALNGPLSYTLFILLSIHRTISLKLTNC